MYYCTRLPWKSNTSIFMKNWGSLAPTSCSIFSEMSKSKNKWSVHTTIQWPTKLTDILESRHETVVGRSASFKTTPERWSVLAEKRSGCHCRPRKHLPTLNNGNPEVFSVTTSRSLDVKAVPCMALPARHWLPPNTKDAQEISIQFTSVDNFLSLGKSLSQALLLAVIYPFLTWRKNHPIW